MVRNCGGLKESEHRTVLISFPVSVPVFYVPEAFAVSVSVGDASTPVSSSLSCSRFSESGFDFCFILADVLLYRDGVHLVS